MAITQYQVTIQKPVLSYNGGEQPYFDPVTAARLIALGYATAVGTPPPVVQVPSGAPVNDVVDDGGLPVPARMAGSPGLTAPAGGVAGNCERRPCGRTPP